MSETKNKKEKKTEEANVVPVLPVLESAADFQLQVAARLGSIKERFIEIGYYLQQCDRKRWYNDLGYSTLAECAEALFEIKKSTCYALMNVAEKFSLNGVLCEQYKRFSQSQLVALSADYAFRMKYYEKIVPSDAPVLEIRDVVRCSRLTNQYLNRAFNNSDYKWRNLVIDSRAYLSSSNRNSNSKSGEKVKKEKLKEVDAYNMVKNALDQMFKEDLKLSESNIDYWRYSEIMANRIVYNLLGELFV